MKGELKITININITIMYIIIIIIITTIDITVLSLSQDQYFEGRADCRGDKPFWRGLHQQPRHQPQLFPIFQDC